MKPLIICVMMFLSVLCFSSCQKLKTSWMMIDAEAAYNQGNAEKSIRIYKKIIEVNPQQADVHWKLGIAYYALGEKLNMEKEILALRKLNEMNMANDLQQLLDKR
ncbi:MAG TPA: tetratricopeptide repeat protein [Candidatus Omnitrophota bacterium]|nr:tetratricopeptide repeat protein [Candidatus Omnitrophota bacterium]HPD84455.1 tetratricopeptide repeat protein [Candidatus Omnitrophota bacterium]HRZ03313.1 tetratricopeptide repeat protein [Candidatus Omnitrophota bacterium]